MHRRARHLSLALLAAAAPALAALDLRALWDFKDPARSEQRFRDALATAQGDDVLILKTQIARTHGLRRDFAAARSVLAEVEPALASAGPEARARYGLELGRTHISAVTQPAERTPEALAAARVAYQRAWDIARDARLDGLAIDAIHMMAFVDTAPAERLKWNDLGLALVRSSTQDDARRWEASLRNNRGMALKELGRLDEALADFRRQLALREQMGGAQGIHVAHWMIAWTLRAMGRLDEALEIQQRLEREATAAGRPDPHVFEELEHLHRARGDAPRAAHYAALRQAARQP